MMAAEVAPTVLHNTGRPFAHEDILQAMAACKLHEAIVVRENCLMNSYAKLGQLKYRWNLSVYKGQPDTTFHMIWVPTTEAGKEGLGKLLFLRVE